MPDQNVVTARAEDQRRFVSAIISDRLQIVPMAVDVVVAVASAVLVDSVVGWVVFRVWIDGLILVIAISIDEHLAC